MEGINLLQVATAMARFISSFLRFLSSQINYFLNIKEADIAVICFCKASAVILKVKASL
jgi:hypothetical protein